MRRCESDARSREGVGATTDDVGGEKENELAGVSLDRLVAGILEAGKFCDPGKTVNGAYFGAVGITKQQSGFAIIHGDI